MATRNFWIEADIDGRKSRLTGGPQRADGGFTMVIKMRHEGGIVTAAHVHAHEHNGKLYLTVRPDDQMLSVPNGENGGFGVATERH